MTIETFIWRTQIQAGMEGELTYATRSASFGDGFEQIAGVLGSKRGGVFQTILGVALVAVGAVASYFGGGAVGVPLMQFGAAMALGGVVQMLSTTMTLVREFAGV